MQCQLLDFVDLGSDEAFLILEVESMFVDQKALSPPTEAMSGRKTLAKIDAELIDPIVCLGNARFARIAGLYSMPQPTRQEDGTWYSTPFNPAAPSLGAGDTGSVEYRFKDDPNLFGYNPIKALVMPRPIGWLSTYRKEDRVPHLAPYSFFCDVGRDKQPMVAFCGYRNNNGTVKKDAQTDVEATGCFGWNVVKKELAVHMNLSSAQLDRQGSEFELSKLTPIPAREIDAPVVSESPVHFECQHLKSVDVGNYTVIVGKVLSISIDKTVLTDGEVDVSKFSPLSRCGYADEYAVVTGPFCQK
jgi:flavin reductase (DIM6/NTAB) family NADH-FMN oxidoreductase RutF